MASKAEKRDFFTQEAIPVKKPSKDRAVSQGLKPGSIEVATTSDKE